MPLVSPSIHAADFLHLEDEVLVLERSSADMIHLDVMDGTMVPNISFGFPVIDAVRRVSSKPLDTHLMIVNPDRYFERFASSGVDMLSFHLEAAARAGADCAVWLRKIKALGMEAGLAINPDIPISTVFPYVGDADFILVMSVFAGYSGQQLIPDTFGRVRELKRHLLEKGSSCKIEIDGGVTPDNCRRLAESGADILVSASSVFGSDTPEAVIETLHCR